MSGRVFTFEVSHGGQVTQTLKHEGNTVKIGKLSSSHLRIDDALVSGMHAVVEVVGPDVNVVDLGSLHGTFVDGRRVGRAKLRSGTVIGIGGDHLQIKVVFNAPPAPPIKKPLMLTEKQWLLVADILSGARQDLEDSEDAEAAAQAELLTPLVAELAEPLLMGLDWEDSTEPCKACERRRTAGLEGQCPACANERARNQRGA